MVAFDRSFEFFGVYERDKRTPTVFLIEDMLVDFSVVSSVYKLYVPRQ